MRIRFRKKRSKGHIFRFADLKMGDVIVCDEGDALSLKVVTPGMSPTCVAFCPAGQDIMHYVQLIGVLVDGNFDSTFTGIFHPGELVAARSYHEECNELVFVDMSNGEKDVSQHFEIRQEPFQKFFIRRRERVIMRSTPRPDEPFII